jgi:hypothetical protein
MVAVSVAGAAPGEAQRVPQKNNLVADIGEIPNKLPKSKLELTSKRTKFSTRYLNPNGTFTEEIFLDPQFYQDPTDKKWKTIDNNLKSSVKRPGNLENTANEFKTFFASETGTSDLVSVEKDGKSLTLLPVKANQVKGAVTGNKINYPGIFADADLLYSIQGGGVKEDIILHQFNGNNTFSFELKLNGLKAITEKDGTIAFVDSKGNKLWYFDKPFMTDAAGK